MDQNTVNFLMRWLPTYVALFLIILAGFALRASIIRDERRKEGERKRTHPPSPA